MQLEAYRFPLWLGAVCGYADGIDAFKSLDALTDTVLYALFVGSVLIVACRLMPER